MLLPYVALGLWLLATLLRLMWELVVAHVAVVVSFAVSAYLRAILKVGVISVAIYAVVAIASRIHYWALLAVTITLGFYVVYCYQHLMLVWRYRTAAREALLRQLDADLAARFRE